MRGGSPNVKEWYTRPQCALNERLTSHKLPLVLYNAYSLETYNSMRLNNGHSRYKFFERDFGKGACNDVTFSDFSVAEYCCKVNRNL